MHQSVRVGWRMKYPQTMWSGHFVLPGSIFPSYDKSTEGGALCNLRSSSSRFLMAAGGSLRVGCQHPTPLGEFEAGGPFQNSRRQKRKYSLEVYVQKELDSKVDKKPDTGKSDLALDQQIRIWGSLQNVGFLLAGLSMPLLNIPAIIGNPINYWYSVYNMCRYAQGCSKMVSQSKTLSLSKIRVRTTRCCLSLAGSYYSCGWYQYNVRTDTAACCCTCSLHQ